MGGALWGVTEGKEGVRSRGARAPEPTQRKPAFAWDDTSSCHPLTGTAPATCNLRIMERSADTCAPSWPYPTSRTCSISQTLPLLFPSSLTRAAMSTWVQITLCTNTEFQSTQETSFPHHGLWYVAGAAAGRAHSGQGRPNRHRPHRRALPTAVHKPGSGGGPQTGGLGRPCQL